MAHCDSVLVQGDEEQLRTLLDNLLDNAIRYTPSGGTVQVGVTAGQGEAVLQIADSGPGIALEERRRVFDRFYRAAGNGAPGSGLGLSIVQRVAHAHSASVELADGPLHGLLVRVRFPLLSLA
jgi:signal transduction histidine kinase